MERFTKLPVFVILLLTAPALHAQAVPTFVGVRTFLGAPYVTKLDDLHADFAVLGVPFDEGTWGQPGERYGPRDLREFSQEYNHDLTEGFYYIDGDRTVLKGKHWADVGDVEVKAGHKLSGRVVLADGKPVPAGTRVLLSREEAWDSAQTVVDKEGRLSFAGLPSETYSLNVNVKGYHLSPKNASVDLLNGFRLLGVVREDTTGLRLLLEPGPEPTRENRSDGKFWEEYRQRREAPLRGAPGEKPSR